jgi:hypothetical protein
MEWLADNLAIIVICIMGLGFIIITVRDYVGRKSNVIGRPYK